MIKLTIGLTICNRLLYTKALLKSLEGLLARSDVQAIVVDSASSEPGTEEALKSIDHIDELYMRKQRDWSNDEFTAKNIIITRAKGEVILFLQDDSQMIVDSDVLMTIVNDFIAMDDVKCLSMTALRRASLETKYRFFAGGIRGESGLKYWRTPTNHLYTVGLFKKSLYDTLGLYPDGWPKDSQGHQDVYKVATPGSHARDWWGKAEDYYNELVNHAYPDMMTLQAHVPAFGNIWNDPRGYYAIVRGNKRCGHYLPPAHPSGLYYGILTYDLINTMNNRQLPAHFMEACHPLGWQCARDKWGDQEKFSQERVIKEGPHTTLYEDDENLGDLAGAIKVPVVREAPKRLIELGKKSIKPVDLSTRVL